MKHEKFCHLQSIRNDSTIRYSESSIHSNSTNISRYVHGWRLSHCILLAFVFIHRWRNYTTSYWSNLLLTCGESNSSMRFLLSVCIHLYTHHHFAKKEKFIFHLRYNWNFSKYFVQSRISCLMLVIELVVYFATTFSWG